VELHLKGKTAIVTGASQGIGRAIAEALHREGVELMLAATGSESLQAAARSIRGMDGDSGAPVHTIVADLSLRAEVERMSAEALRLMGHVDILVNNAARAFTGDFFRMSEQELQAVWEVKAFGYVRAVRAIAPHMMERKSGCIINIIGSSARVPAEDFIVGSMVNAALVSFTRGISRELARHNVRIVSVSPGWTMTERQQRSFEMRAAAQNTPTQEIEQRAARAIPTRRLVTMDEIASVVLLVASDMVPNLTGEDLLIDGGATPAI
jgi:3-oxoacyl-[acyl-carrier protein] reductase/bacilysin biosynthesis oxidoreductase BacG